MAMHEVRRRNRQIGGARDEVDVDPGVNAKSGRMTRGKDGRQRIEARRLALEIGRARLEAAGEICVASSPHLHEQRVESILARGPHQRRDRLGRSSDVRRTQSARVSAGAVSPEAEEDA